MNIVFDCFKLVKGTGKSIGIYNLTNSLIKHFSIEQLNSDNKKFVNSKIFVLGNKYNKNDFNNINVIFIEINILNPLNKFHCLLWELIIVLIFAFKCKADRLIFPRGFSAVFHPIKDIVIIHDMIPFYYHTNFPGYLNEYVNQYIMKRLASSAKYSYRVITDSFASKDDIIKYCKCDGRKINVIYPGCEKIIITKDSTFEYNVGEPYICSITSYLPHKNAIGLLKSYEKYCNVEEKPLKLVIIGISDLDSICSLDDNIKNNIICYKYIKNDADMYRIIKESELFIFLSLKEGFGFPPVEAHELGVPVLCSDCSSVGEVTKNFANLVNPNDYNEIGNKIRTSIENREKNFLKKNGYFRFDYNWDLKVKEYINVIFN